MSGHACHRCLARAWLLGRLAGHLDRERSRIEPLLELPDEELIEAVGGRHRGTLMAALSQWRSRPISVSERLEPVCRCDELYPSRLRDLPAQPAAVFVAGGLGRLIAAAGQDPVALVGSRRPSGYGLEVARSLGRDLARAGIAVISGMALGIDAAAHAGALEAGSPTIAVLPGSADRPYPRQKRRLHQTIVEQGAAVSELGGDVGIHRWMFPARNRLIAALAAMTIVVEASAGSGALLTARVASELGRPVGAVPGRVTSRQATGTNELLAGGAQIVRGAQDVLDALFGAGARTAGAEWRPALSATLQRLLGAIGECGDTPTALGRAGLEADQGLAALAQLEVDGYIRRSGSGRFEVVP